MSSDALHWHSILQLAPLIRTRQISPVDLVRSMLDRIQAYDGYLRAFITVTPDDALAQARAAEEEIGAGKYRGPLHGIPVAHKDTYRTKGVRTTCHSAAFLDNVPDEDAAVVEAWRAAGAISLGKTNTYELASGREQSIFGIPRNPWNPERVTGGSSSGSGGGLAAGFFFGASGTDAGGSIRAPAALCGVVGLRPTFGWVSRRGVQGSAGSVSCCGPLARTAGDLELLLEPLLSYDPWDPNAIQAPTWLEAADEPQEDLAGVRIGVPTAYFFDTDKVAPDVMAAVNAAIEDLQRLGAELEEIDLPHVHLCDAIYEVIAYSESAAAYAELVRTSPDAVGFSTRVGLETGLGISAAEYLQAQKVRSLIHQDFSRAFEQVDFIAAPTTYATARPPGDDARSSRPHPRRPMGLSGGPSLSVPCGFCSEGLPVGLQLAGPPWSDRALLKVARAYEEQARAEPEWPEISVPASHQPLTMSTSSRGVQEAVDARLDSMRAELENTIAGLELDGIAPAVRFRHQ